MVSPSTSYSVAWKKPAIFFPQSEGFMWRRWKYFCGGGAARSAFGAGRKETRLALAAAAVAVPEGLSQIRELFAQACPLPRVSAQRSPPPRT
jgi:hypothetical protein